jgi:DNA-binding response OmpR family regulator
MRPKKVILLLLANEQELSATSYMLGINGYIALQAANAAEAVAIFSKTAINLVIVDFDITPVDGNALVKQLKKIASHVPMILVGDLEAMSGKFHQADALLPKKGVSTFDLLERIKIMIARRRGPRKGIYRCVDGKLTLKNPEVSA